MKKYIFLAILPFFLFCSGSEKKQENQVKAYSFTPLTSQEIQ